MVTIGQVFGSYRVIAESYVERRVRRVLCECACGRRAVVQVGNLRSGHSTRCRSCATRAKSRIHGETSGGRGSAEYRIWAQMIARCSNPTHERFPDYGGRGIVVCDRWRESLTNFIADMGRRPSPDHQLERRDNDGPYSPENCVWATRTEQGRNKRNNVLITAHGRTMPVSAWAEEMGIGASTIRRRLRLGWPGELAVSIAPQFGRRVRNPQAEVQA